MKQLIILFTFSILIVNICHGQQNFFNVVSSDITPKHKLFFQQQLNFIQNSVQSNTTLSYGLGHNFEIGVNYFGLNFNRLDNYNLEKVASEAPYNYFGMINLQKRFDVNDQFGFSIGLQQGITTTSNIHFGGNYYSNFIYKNNSLGLKCIGGFYYAMNSLYGEGDRFFNKGIGIQAGFEKSIIKDKWTFQADFISGKHSLGEMVIGTAFYATKKWVLSFGYQIPNIQSQSQKGFVFELTFIPSEN